MTDAGTGLKTPKRSFEILELLRAEDGASVSRVAERLDSPPSTVHGHLSTLEDCGYVVREDGEYRLGLRFAYLGNHALDSTRAYRIADRYTEKVAAETGCRSIFGVEQNGRGIYVARDPGEHSAWEHEQIGNWFSLHTTAAGKAIIAHLPRERVDEIVERWGLPRQTPNSIVDRAELLAELRSVRETGVGFNREEHVPGVRAVSAPVFGPSDDVVGGLSASGPANQLRGHRFETDLPETLLGIANEFELDLALSE
jgi:DNA-binding IclR family transcriptional regulator